MSSVNRLGMAARPLYRPGTKIATINASELITKSNYQDVGRYVEADLALVADTEATLPALIEACRRLITPDRKRAFEQRGARTGGRQPRRLSNRASSRRRGAGTPAPFPRRACPPRSGTRSRARTGRWCRTPSSSATGRTGSGTSRSTTSSSAGRARTASATALPAAVGAALANRKHGRLSVNIQCDGDLNYAPACCGPRRTTAFRC